MSNTKSNKKVFNPNGDDSLNNRLMWGGSNTGLINLNQCRYSWAIPIWKQMRNNFWIADKVDLSTDVNLYNELTSSEVRVYDSILGYLTFLDSIQVFNLPNIKLLFTAPEIELGLSEQISQEAGHNQAYQVIIETIIPSDKRQSIYDKVIDDKVLKRRCKYIADIYQQYLDTPTRENYFVTLIGNYLLESLYFYQGFMFFYNLSSRSLMGGTADMIRYINKDEATHTYLFQKIIQEAMSLDDNGKQLYDFNYSKDQILELTDGAVQQEIKWMQYICNNEILGITDESISRYSYYLANKLLDNIGIPKIYFDVEGKPYKNPYKHLERIADTSNEGNLKSNFFDGTVTSYNMASAIEGWEDF